MRLSNKDLEHINKIDLFTYFSIVDSDELMKDGKNRYRLKSHDSIDLSNGYWYRFSNHTGGKNALEYLLKVENKSFYEACNILLNLKVSSHFTHSTIQKKTPVLFKLPPSFKNQQLIIDYLCNQRKISSNIVLIMIKQGYIYEAKYDHAAVFLGFDENHSIRFACKRSIDSKDKRDIKGSDKRYSFSILQPNINQLFVFESVIDLLSYMTILEMRNEDPFQYNYLALDGISLKPLERVLKQYSIHKIYLMLDNDEAGKMATKQITEQYHKQYFIYDESPKEVKDINDLLKLLL